MHVEPRLRTRCRCFSLGHEPAASSRLASAPHRSPLGRVQLLPFLGSIASIGLFVSIAGAGSMPPGNRLPPRRPAAGRQASPPLTCGIRLPGVLDRPSAEHRVAPCRCHAPWRCNQRQSGLACSAGKEGGAAGPGWRRGHGAGQDAAQPDAPAPTPAGEPLTRAPNVHRSKRTASAIDVRMNANPYQPNDGRAPLGGAKRRRWCDEFHDFADARCRPDRAVANSPPSPGAGRAAAGQLLQLVSTCQRSRFRWAACRSGCRACSACRRGR